MNTSIICNNISLMRNFYSDILGLKEIMNVRNAYTNNYINRRKDKNSNSDNYAIFYDVNGNNIIELISFGYGKQKNIGKIVLSVNDIFQTIDNLERNGVEIVNAPYFGDMHILQIAIRDPEKNEIEIRQNNNF